MDNRDDNACLGCRVAVSRPHRRCAGCKRALYAQVWLWGALIVGMAILIIEGALR